MELLRVGPELSIYLSNVVLFRDEQSPEVTVDSPGIATELPDDGNWIEEGIQLKLKIYGGAEAGKDLTLVIGVEGPCRSSSGRTNSLPSIVVTPLDVETRAGKK